MTKWTTAGIPSQKGKLAVVTGANSGIGWHTALELARAGAEVILTVRSEDKGGAAVEDVRQLLPPPIVEKLFKKIVDCSVKLSKRFGMPRVSNMKKRLTDAALDLMWENSYGTTSVDAICERAGAKKGSFYYFFKSKSDLTVAALEAEWNKNKANMDALFSPTIPPLERLDRYFDYVHDRLAELQKECGSILGCPLLSIGSEVSTQDQGVRTAVDGIWDRKIKYFESAIRDAHAQGLIVAPDPEAKARALFACYHGTLAQARIQNDVELIRDFKQVALDVLGIKHVPAATS